MPIGCPGELIIQGPIVGRGYIDEAQSTQSFLGRPPTWSKMVPQHQGVRFYKTGDVVRYDSDGSLLIEGRKDAQIKLNGQRVEVEEVESRITRSLPGSCQTAVCVIESASARPILCAFVAPASQITEAGSWQTPKALFQELTATLSASLASYMVPSRFKLLDSLPKTVSGKLNYRALRSIELPVLDEAFLTVEPQDTETLPPIAQQLQRLWGRVLHIDPNYIGMSDNFFRRGGDSIAAMRLAASARSLRIGLTVAEIFRAPTLQGMAEIGRSHEPAPQADHIMPWALTDREHKEDVCRAATLMCGVEEADVEDVYPCSMVQEGMMATSEQDHAAFLSRRDFQLPQELDVAKLCAAVAHVIGERPILRSRIVNVGNLGAFQVVLRTSKQQAEFLFFDRDDPLVSPTSSPYGAVLNRFSINDGVFTWIAHHATYDSHTLGLIERDIVSAYHASELRGVVSYRDFIQHTVNELDAPAARRFWRSYLSGCTTPSWPPNKPRIQRSSNFCSYSCTRKLPRATQSQFTDFTYVKVAWALLLGQYMGTTDAIFASTLGGRDSELPNAGDVLGPTIATVPVRATWHLEGIVEDLLSHTQTRSAEVSPFQHTGLAKIRDMVRVDVDFSLKALTLLVMQDSGLETENALNELGLREIERELSYSSDFPIAIEATIRKEQITFHIHYDQELSHEDDITRMAHQLAHTISQLRLAKPSTLLGQIEFASDEEKQLIAGWVQDNPPQNVLWPHVQLSLAAHEYPQASAVDAWDGHLTYSELEVAATNMSALLASFGVTDGSIVALCLEKSKLVVVIMYAIWRLGAAFTQLDFRDPSDRMYELVDRVAATVFVTNIRGKHGLVERSVFLDS